VEALKIDSCATGNSGRRYLVTGAAGFTGRHLCALLRRRGGCQAVAAGRGQDIVPCDFSDPVMVAVLLEKVLPTGIFHCIGSFTNSWEADFHSNVATTRTLLESLRGLGTTCRVMLIGSAAEYGFAPDGPIPETCPLRPVSTYGLTKVMQTQLMDYFVRNHDMDIVMARTFNLFGTGCSPLLLPGRVAKQIERVRQGHQKTIQVRSLASLRDYLHVGDAVKAYVRIMEHGSRGEVYNVGSGTGVALTTLVQGLLAPSGLSMENVEVLRGDDDDKPNVPLIFADTTKLRCLPTIF